MGDIVKNWLENGETARPLVLRQRGLRKLRADFDISRVGCDPLEIDDGGDDMQTRQMTIRRFDQGITKIIVNVGQCWWPVLIAMSAASSYARPTKSEIRWLQCPWPWPAHCAR